MDKAKETLQKALNFIRDKWGAVGKTARLVIMSVGAAMLIALIITIVLSSRTEYEVLYGGLSNEETSEITSALGAIGVTDVKINAGTISVPRKQSDAARMELSIQGFPKNAFNFNIWDEGVNMFSTDSERKEKQRQQLSMNIAATLRCIPDVQDAIVIITPPEERLHVISSERKPSQASVMLILKPGVRLTSKQIEGIKTLVLTSVPGLTIDNLSLNNQDGLELIADDSGNAETALAVERQRWNLQLSATNALESDYEAAVRKLLDGTVRDYRVSVSAALDFSNWQREDTVYTGSNVDENGVQSGVIDDQSNKVAFNSYGEEGGAVGTTVDADISPDYPTLEQALGADQFYERIEDTHYMVNQSILQAQSNGYTVGKISCAVQIDDIALTQDQIDEWRQLIANAIGAELANVTVKQTVFPLSPPPQNSAIPTPSATRNLLIFIIISLGALLIILFFLAIMSSGSKKKRLIKARTVAMQTGGGSAQGFPDEFAGYPGAKMPEEEDESLKIQSLLGGNEGETREALLKNEIREFAKSNPDIVAQLIRTWIRE